MQSRHTSSYIIFSIYHLILGAVGGIFLGGFLVKKWNWNCKQILKGASVMAFIATICVCCALIGCEGRTVTSPADHNQKR